MQTIVGYVIVFVGAGLGGAVRHGVNRVALASGSTLPWGTFTINLLGSLLMGVIAGWFAFRGSAGQPFRLFLTTGLLGGFTTFSAFALETGLLLERGRVREAVLYACASTVLSVVVLFAGMALVRR
jgi:CrcB protein